MNTNYRSETGTAANGAVVEVATVTHEGHAFTALGSVIDEAQGVIVGYPSLLDGRYVLRTWDGAVIGDMTITGRARGFNRTELTCWALVRNGRRYHGRNVGTGMVVTLRAGRAI